jgi:phage shock protein PspC (stress-responsive transcriptional regulator)
MNATAPQSSCFLRPRDGRILGGVAAALARRFELDATLVRGAFALLALLAGLGVLLYLAGWALIPQEE